MPIKTANPEKEWPRSFPTKGTRGKAGVTGAAESDQVGIVKNVFAVVTEDFAFPSGHEPGHLEKRSLASKITANSFCYWDEDCNEAYVHGPPSFTCPMHIPAFPELFIVGMFFSPGWLRGLLTLQVSPRMSPPLERLPRRTWLFAPPAYKTPGSQGLLFCLLL